MLPCPALGPVPACSLCRPPCRDARSSCVQQGPGVEGCREGLSLHVSDPRTRCMRISMASRNRGFVLPFELFLRAVSSRTCGFPQQLYSPPISAVSKLRIVIPDLVKARGNILVSHHVSLNIDHDRGKANPRHSWGQRAVLGSYCLLGCISSWATRGLAKTPSVVALCRVGKRGIPFTGLYSSVLHL